MNFRVHLHLLGHLSSACAYTQVLFVSTPEVKRQSYVEDFVSFMYRRSRMVLKDRCSSGYVVALLKRVYSTRSGDGMVK